MADRILVALITAPSREVAESIARMLVEKRLAACVNILPPVRSIYRWEGKVSEEDEVLLLVKTRPELFSTRLLPAVQEMHPYQLPEIIALPVEAGLEDYLKWVAQEATG
jgi:periplasmic divalent cation tolerance protein